MSSFESSNSNFSIIKVQFPYQYFESSNCGHEGKKKFPIRVQGEEMKKTIVYITCLWDKVCLSSNTVQMTLSKHPGVVSEPLYL